MTDDTHITSLLSVYQALVQRHAAGRAAPRFYQPGPTLKKQKLWLKLERIAEWCRANKAQPSDFVVAQFEEWDVKGEAYPTPRMLGATPRCVGRFERWQEKRQALLASRPDPAESNGQRVVEAVASRRGISPREFFHDVFLVRLLPPFIAKAHPDFRRARAEGHYDSELAQTSLREYLNG